LKVPAKSFQFLLPVDLEKGNNLIILNLNSSSAGGLGELICDFTMKMNSVKGGKVARICC